MTAWAVHRPDKRGGERNHHAHILLPTRRVDEAGQFSRRKIRELDDRVKGPEEIRAIRALWEELANEALREANLDTRVNTGRTVDPIPTIPRRHVAIERRAWTERHGGKPPLGLPVPELVADGSATGPGRHLAHRVRTRARRTRRRQDRAHAVSGITVFVATEKCA